MKRFSRTFQLAALILVVGFVAACRGKGAVSITPSPSNDALASSTIDGNGPIMTRGIVRPAQVLQLGFGTGGALRRVAAQVGVEVKAEDVLAELDTTTLEFELGKARAVVALRQAALDGLLNGPNATLAERAEVANAQQVAQAEIALQVAQLQLKQARFQGQANQRSHALDVALARSKLEQAGLQLAQARAQTPYSEIVAAQVGLARAQDAFDTAQVEYKKALDRHWEPQEVRDAYAKAVWLAEQEVELVRARLSSALDAQHAHTLGLDLMAVQHGAVAAQLTQTLQMPIAYTPTLALLEAEVDRAQLQLDGLRAWQNPHLDPAPPEEIAQAKALLQQTELTVAELEWQLRGAQIGAPFDGVVANVYMQPGEWSAAGTPIVELLDTSGWLVETRNVSELTIGRVQVGAEAIVHVNALAGETVRGRVVTVSPVAVVQQGDTTYTLTIELEPTDLNLRSGMTAQVEILTE